MVVFPRHTDIDMIIIREQTEGEYTSLEHEVCIDDIAIDSILLFYHLKQIDFIQLWVCTVITHRGWHTRLHLMCFSFIPTTFDMISDLLLNRITVTWSLFVGHVNVKMMNLPYDFDNNSNISKIRTVTVCPWISAQMLI